MARAAIGFSSHLGWTAAVAVVGTRKKIEVVDRRRIRLIDDAIPESHEPWHKASKDPKRAKEIVRLGTRGIEGCARRGVAALVKELEKQGHRVVGAGVLQSGGPPKLAFESILAAHTLQHTAEGRMMRDALAKASKKRGAKVLGVKERELFDVATSKLGLSEQQLVNHLAELGKPMGSPWAKDQKNATLAAWLCL